MKRIFLFILLFIPFIVLAEDCDISKITISSIEQTDISGNTEVISEPTINGKSIGLDLKMYEVGDSITYDLVVNNASNEDYMINEDTFKSDSNYIEYILTTEDNSNVVKAKSSKNMYLTVSYKNEVDSSLLTNNKYNASNKLNLSMNTAEKVKEIDEISTDPVALEPIIKRVKNPITSSVGFKLLIVILLTTIVIILLTVINKKQYNKYFIILFIIYLIPTIYAICTCDIEVESTIEIEQRPKLFDTVVGLADEQNACVIKYTGEVTDEVGKTVTASNVYFNQCTDKRNIIFNNMCFQIIRTTDTGGIKMVYNGEPVDGKCLSTREDHKGIVEEDYGPSEFDTSYLYGDGFTYDISNNTFTLTNTFTETWSDSTYENLLSKYTCMSNEATCEKLYQINSYYSNIESNYSYYIIDDTNYAQIGTSSFNARSRSLSLVGYMFNKVYFSQNISPGTTEYKYGSSYTYENGTYTLAGTTQTISDWNTGYTQLNNTHYTCWNTTGTCSTISYVYSTNSGFANYIEMKDGKSISDVINEMLYDNNVNKYNSSIKGIIDAWYKQNLSGKTNKLEDTVYCNDRSITSYGGWNPNGGSVTAYIARLQFKNNTLNSDLSCLNVTDQFTVSNSKAKLMYPVGLVTHGELNILTNNNSSTYYDILTKTGALWWSLSPHYFSTTQAGMRCVAPTGDIDDGDNINNSNIGIRFAISLKNSVTIVDGTGSEEDPWIVE